MMRTTGWACNKWCYFLHPFSRFVPSSLLIVYEGCDESCEFFLSPDFHFLSPAGRSNSDCELRIGENGSNGYKPARSRSDAQIPRLKKMSSAVQRRQQLDFDSLSITDTSSDYLTDDTQSFSTSPQSVDSGLECLMESSSSTDSNACCWSNQGRFKRLLRPNGTGYECDNSTDSTDSGVFSSSAVINKKALMKRSAAYTDSEDSESDLEHHGQRMLCRPMELPSGENGKSVTDGIGSGAEEEGELTPVLETSRTEEFSRDDDGQMQKKRRVEAAAERQQQLRQPKTTNWADCVDVRMIDFAHTTFSGYLGLDERIHWGPDNGYLLGLDSLTAILSELRGASQRCWGASDPISPITNHFQNINLNNRIKVNNYFDWYKKVGNGMHIGTNSPLYTVGRSLSLSLYPN